jgi:hypothetical protein
MMQFEEVFWVGAVQFWRGERAHTREARGAEKLVDRPGSSAFGWRAFSTSACVDYGLGRFREVHGVVDSRAEY